jgi:undecaprenyl-diphosphatase
MTFKITGAAPFETKEDKKTIGMPFSHAIIFGIVEGVTEYLPISSTGHLLLADHILKNYKSSISSKEDEKIKEASDAYTICIQIGAILAIIGLYRRHIKQMVRGLAGKDRQGLKLLINIILGFLPAAVIGLLLNRTIKAYLFGIWPVIAAWFVGGIAILIISSKNRKPHQKLNNSISLYDLSWQSALIIGMAQCIAMWPGISRSLITIGGGLLTGLTMASAVEFSFLLGVVTLSAATAYDILKHGEIMIQMFHPLPLATGVVVAFVSAVISVKWMVTYLNKHGLEIFGYYRIAIAILAGSLIILNII